jgi:hypothetical protein
MTSHMIRVGLSIVAALALLNSQTTPSLSPPEPLPFSCDTFGPFVDEGTLKVQFGNANVTTGLVPWGGAEGDYNEGTILFADRAEARLEIYWQNRVAKRTPEWVDIRGSRSQWRSPGGITLGADLKTVERLNGRPFRLIGWGTDVGGALYSWESGLLARQDADGCRIGFRFNSPDAAARPDLRALLRQVTGDRPYSSGHRAMQALNPRINEAVIVFTRTERTARSVQD